MSSGTAKGTLFSEGDEMTPRSAASSDLGCLSSSYEGLNWLESLCDAYPLQLTQDSARWAADRDDPVGFVSSSPAMPKSASIFETWRP